MTRILLGSWKPQITFKMNKKAYCILYTNIEASKREEHTKVATDFSSGPPCLAPMLGIHPIHRLRRKSAKIVDGLGI